MQLNWYIFPCPLSRLEAQEGTHVRVGRTDRGGHSEPGATAAFWHPVSRHSSRANLYQRPLPQGECWTFLKEINHSYTSIRARY